MDPAAPRPPTRSNPPVHPSSGQLAAHPHPRHPQPPVLAQRAEPHPGHREPDRHRPVADRHPHRRHLRRAGIPLLGTQTRPPLAVPRRRPAPTTRPRRPLPRPAHTPARPPPPRRSATPTGGLRHPGSEPDSASPSSTPGSTPKTDSPPSIDCGKPGCPTKNLSEPASDARRSCTPATSTACSGNGSTSACPTSSTPPPGPLVKASIQGTLGGPDVLTPGPGVPNATVDEHDPTSG
jgi:hypothetical protein